MQAPTPAELLKISALVVYPKDVAFVIRKKKRSASQLLKNIRFALGKEDHHMVTLGELCAYLDLSVALTYALLCEKGMF